MAYTRLYRVHTRRGRVVHEYMGGYIGLDFVARDVERGDYGPGDFVLLTEGADPARHSPQDVRWRGLCRPTPAPVSA